MIKTLPSSITHAALEAAYIKSPIWAQILGSQAIGTQTFYSWQQVLPSRDPVNTTQPRFQFMVGGESGLVASPSTGISGPSTTAVYPALAGLYNSPTGITINPVVDPNGNSLAVNEFVLIQKGYFDVNYSWVYYPIGASASQQTQNPFTFVGNLTGLGTNANEPGSVIVNGSTVVTAWPCIAYLNLDAAQRYLFNNFIPPAEFAPAWAWFPDGTPPRFSASDLYRAWFFGTTISPPPGQPSGDYGVYFIDYHTPYTQIGVYAEGQGSFNTDTLVAATNFWTIDGANIQFGPPFLASNGFTVPRLSPYSSPPPPATFTQLSINYGGIFFGATGTDGVGNIYLSGLNINIGGQ